MNKPNFEKSIVLQNGVLKPSLSLKSRLFSTTSEPLGVVNKEAMTAALNSKEEVKIMMVPNPADKWWRIASILSGSNFPTKVNLIISKDSYQLQSCSDWECII